MTIPTKFPQYFEKIDFISNSKPIYIYGAGERGKELFERLRHASSGYNVIGYIDSYRNFEQSSVPVFAFDKFTASRAVDNNFQVLIASLYWIEIVAKLEAVGIDCFMVYLPESVDHLPFKIASLIDQENGTFVEAGANNGFLFSNSYLLERYCGWSGLLVEAIPSLYARCVENRPNAIVEGVALVSSFYKGDTVSLIDTGLTSKIVAEACIESESNSNAIVNVTAKTLNSLLVKHNLDTFDLLSLDVEGYELEVLKGLDLERYCPEHLVIEANQRNALISYLAPYYEPIAELTRRDILFKRV